MPDCAACPQIYRGNCKDTCEEHRAEVAQNKQRCEGHVHDLHMKIMRPGILRGAV